MTSHGPSDDRAREPSKDGDADFASEQELDKILSQAHILANKLCVEVGAVGEGDRPTEEKGLAPAGNEAEGKGLDQELDQLQHLVEETQTELEALAEGRSPLIEANGAGANVAGEDRQGDTSAEAHNATEQTNTGACDDLSAAASPVQPVIKTSKLRPGVVGTGMIGLLGASPASQEGDRSQAAPGDFEEDTSKSRSGGAAQNWIRRILQATGDRLAPATLAFSVQLVRALEWLDAPFRGLGAGLRRAIGWIAVATAGTSVVVYMLSLFR